ncbi:hypothetical protein FACS189464_2150 [Bacteroidia bacterium]|nr:hypothetical protein FACS189464_2150 [Bacteroidia bacterium]
MASYKKGKDMSLLKNLFRKTTTKESGNDKPSKEFSPEMQLKIEQSRISYNLAVSTKEDLQERFGANDLEIACSVAEEVTMTIEGVVKSEETRREIENYLLKAGVDKIFNNLKVEN